MQTDAPVLWTWRRMMECTALVWRRGQEDIQDFKE